MKKENFKKRFDLRIDLNLNFFHEFNYIYEKNN